MRGRFWNWVQSPCGLSSLAVGTPDTWSCAWPHLRGSDWSCRARACDCGYPCARRRAVSALLPPLPSCAPPPPPTQGRCSQLGAAQPASFGAPVGRRTGLGPPNILNHTSCHYETLSLIRLVMSICLSCLLKRKISMNIKAESSHLRPDFFPKGLHIFFEYKLISAQLLN